MTHVIFVCWGNICRSPMAERLAESYAEEFGLHGVRFSSAGTSNEEAGRGIDRRAVAILQQRDARATDHQAHQITLAEAREASHLVCMEQIHADKLLALDPALAPKISLLTDDVAGAAPGSGVPDPWYGDQEDFEETAATITAALPGLFARLRSQ